MVSSGLGFSFVLKNKLSFRDGYCSSLELKKSESFKYFLWFLLAIFILAFFTQFNQPNLICLGSVRTLISSSSSLSIYPLSTLPFWNFSLGVLSFKKLVLFPKAALSILLKEKGSVTLLSFFFLKAIIMLSIITSFVRSPAEIASIRPVDYYTSFFIKFLNSLNFFLMVLLLRLILLSFFLSFL